MADCSEEQQMEMEALEALFTHEGEFMKLSSTSFRLMLRPAADQPEAQQRLSVTLDVEYPSGYPEKDLPQWTVSASKGCDAAALEVLRRDVQAEMEKQLGSPMMYTIAEFIQEWLRVRGAAPVSMYEQMVCREASAELAAAEEEEEHPEDAAENGVAVTSTAALADKELCSAGDRCTKEEFDCWAEQFREEMVARGIWKGLCGQHRGGVLTGRQLFERDASLATADPGELDGADEAEENSKRETGDADGEKARGTAQQRSNSRQPTLPTPSVAVVPMVGSASGKQALLSLLEMFVGTKLATTTVLALIQVVTHLPRGVPKRLLKSGVMWENENLFTADDPGDLPSD